MTEPDDQRPRHGCLLATAGLALLVGATIVGALVIVGSGDGDDGGGDSVAFQLAVLDGEVPANEDDPAVGPYRAVLERLRTDCTNDAEQVADIAVRASADLIADGIHETLLTILQSMDDAAPGDGEPVDCESLSDPVVAALEGDSP